MVADQVVALTCLLETDRLLPLSTLTKQVQLLRFGLVGKLSEFPVCLIGIHGPRCRLTDRRPKQRAFQRRNNQHVSLPFPVPHAARSHFRCGPPPQTPARLRRTSL